MVLDFDEICGVDPENEDQPDGDIQQDLKPEYLTYKDEGCKFARSCLNCPYKSCIYDEPKCNRKNYRKMRDKEVRRLFKSGRDIPGLAHTFKLSERTVFRITRGKTINKEALKRKRGFKR